MIRITVSDGQCFSLMEAQAARFTVLKAALNHAHSENSRVSSNAAWANIKPFKKVDVPKVRFLTAVEVSALIPACEPSFQALVKAALLTGCRYGELVAMNVEAFDEGKGTVYVADSKNGESRHVDLNDEGITLFAEMTKGRNAKELIFHDQTAKRGNSLNSNGQWKMLVKRRSWKASRSTS